jgi:DNA helicase-2/ATP-dependent DNA helicase PcrA
MSQIDSRWVQGLNLEQARAVNHSHGPLLILAGAGSGKTTVLVARTGRIIADKIAEPEQICVLTFTNKAARELKHRVAHRLGDKASRIWAGTFHSFGLQILRKNHKAAGLPNYFGVIDQSDSQSILREILKDVRVVGKDKFDLDKLMGLVNQRRTGKAQKTVAFDEYDELAEILLPKYLKKLDILGVVDFESLLLKPLELFRESPEVLQGIQRQLQYLMVDEFQDTNEIQMKLIDQISKHHRNLAVVGDDDQSIYGWRGAEVKNILNFPKVYSPCEVVKLERNYRSSSTILEVANRLIEKNRHRHGKILKPEKKIQAKDLPEIFQMDNEDDEAEFIVRDLQERLRKGSRPSELAVLYRSNAQGGLIESLLRQHQIPYTVSGGTAFFDRKEIKDIVAYLRFAITPNDVSLRRIINTPPRGVGDTTVEKLVEYSKQHKLPFFRAAQSAQNAGVNEKAVEALRQLFQFFKALPSRIMNSSSTKSPGQNLLEALQEIHYRDYLYTTTAEPSSADKKWMLVEIFSRVLDSFAKKGGVSEKTLREFVDAMELRDDPNDEEDREKVSLMTLHACKGLEFPHVYIIGVEEDLLPHKNLGSDIDEERRLFYVGITRAQESLTMSYCKSRIRHGVKKLVSPSRFLLEIPKALIKMHTEPYRPVSADQRESMVSGFLASLNQKLDSK